jgi:enamine deaminase RidA (YjgF/YER057c/UK114 family)
MKSSHPSLLSDQQGLVALFHLYPRVFLTNMSDYVALNGIYATHFSPPFPARTVIGVSALPLGARVEIDLVVKA